MSQLKENSKTMADDDMRMRYSLEDAKRYQWASLSNDLMSERTELLKKYLIGPTVLDAGCGGGGYVDYACELGFRACGVDKHDFLLNVAIDKQFKGEFVVGDVCGGIPYQDRAFSTTFCFDVLEHVDDKVAIRELARVTSKRIIVAVPQEDIRENRYLLTYSPYLDLTHLRYYTEERLRELTHLIQSAKVEIFPELSVPLRSFVRRTFKVKSRYPILDKLYARAFDFLLARCSTPQWYINFVAVIDLYSEN